MTEVRHDPNEPARRDDHDGDGATRGTARMEAFADAVFAIAFTLPVVHIVLPESAGEGRDLGRDLVALWPSYLGYALASFVIGLFWVHHHFSGAIYRTTGHWFLIATVIFLAAVGFIAFPARAFAEHISDPSAREIASQYLVIGLTSLSLTWLMKWTVGLRRGQVDSRLDPAYVRRLDHLLVARHVERARGRHGVRALGSRTRFIDRGHALLSTSARDARICHRVADRRGRKLIEGACWR